VRTTLAQGFGRNQSLCHGDLGNLDLLLASGVEPGAMWRVIDGMLRDVRERGWRCANPAEIASPELMTGLAGIGYQMARLAEPERVPSVLMLGPVP
jgi:lantibiotic modifying enzyme